MITKILFTTGDGQFYEKEWEVPITGPTDILVKSVMTGVCRSDIDMMNGSFGPLPLNMQGHEGLGQVIHVGEQVTDVKAGDYVATRGEPAFAGIYPVRKNEYVEVPEAHPRYILEPVACGINVVRQALSKAPERRGRRMLILGSGFLAWVAYHYAANFYDKDLITVCGNSNKDLWGDHLSSEYSGTFDFVVDLSNRTDVFDKPILNNEAVISFGSQKTVTTDFSNLLWKACTMVFPSPRTEQFYDCMLLAKRMIQFSNLDVEPFWTKGYDRDTQWRQAFADGADRPRGYSRGYLIWK